MIDKHHKTLLEKIAYFCQNHSWSMDILYAVVLLYVLAIVCFICNEEPYTLEDYLEEQSMPFLSSR